MIICCICGLIYGLWRRLFGGWEPNVSKWIKEIITNRFFQTIVSIGFLYCVLSINDKWLLNYFPTIIIELGLPKWFLIVIISAIFHGIFWAKGHGPAFDMGNSEIIDEKRYNEVWWAKLLNKWFPNDKMYGYLYDRRWMIWRYSIAPIILYPFFVNPLLILFGFFITNIYSFCWELYNKEKWLYEKFDKNFVDGPTSLAEIISGFVIGYLLCLI